MRAIPNDPAAPNTPAAPPLRRTRRALVALCLAGAAAGLASGCTSGADIDAAGREKVHAYLRAYEKRDFAGAAAVTCAPVPAAEMAAYRAGSPQLTDYEIVRTEASAPLVADPDFSAEVRVTFSDGSRRTERFTGAPYVDEAVEGEDEDGGAKFCVDPVDGGSLQ